MTDDTGSSREMILDALGRLWWIALVRGLLLVLLGGYAFVVPKLTAVTYMQVVGIFIVIDGALALIAGVMGETESKWMTVGRGVIGILFGGFVTNHAAIIAPLALAFIAILLAIAAITNGFMEIVVAIRHRKEIDGEIWMILAGAISIAFGLLIAAQPLDSGGVLLQILGVFAVIAGVSQVVFAFRMKSMTSRLSG